MLTIYIAYTHMHGRLAAVWTLIRHITIALLKVPSEPLTHCLAIAYTVWGIKTHQNTFVHNFSKF